MDAVPQEDAVTELTDLRLQYKSCTTLFVCRNKCIVYTRCLTLKICDSWHMDSTRMLQKAF